MSRLFLALVLSTLPLWAAAQQLTVSAAASLADALREIGPRFEATRPGVTLRFNFAASGVLIQQIAQGAPVDVFLSADQESLDRGLQGKLLDPATRRNVASNTLVLVAPKDSPVAVAAMPDLSRADVRRIAIGKPGTVPAGRYAQQTLQAAQLWAGVSPKLVFADNVRQVLDYVARGEVEAGFVYRTDAALFKDKVREVLAASGHAPITYPAAVVAHSRQAVLARAFLDHLAGAEAQATLARLGFGKP